LAAVLIAVLLAGWIVLSLNQDRRLGCENQSGERAIEICRHLEATMRFGWLGHAIISPGYRVTFEGVREVYCALQVGPDDLPALQSLLGADDWRLQDGADFLIRLATGHDRYGLPEAEVSIFNPSHPDYVLKDGCGS